MVWVATESGLWPRDKGPIYYGNRDSKLRPHGYGKAYFVDGVFWSGIWVKGRLNGFGTMVSAKGDRYEG